jgi:hypothetical protein
VVTVGTLVGMAVGVMAGAVVGTLVAITVGAVVGVAVGAVVGAAVGTGVRLACVVEVHDGLKCPLCAWAITKYVPPERSSRASKQIKLTIFFVRRKRQNVCCFIVYSFSHGNVFITEGKDVERVTMILSVSLLFSYKMLFSTISVGNVPKQGL